MHALQPESEAQSFRFRVKLVAAKYIPDMTVVFPSSLDPIWQREAGSRTRAVGSAVASASAVPGGSPEKARRLPFAVSLPQSALSHRSLCVGMEI